MNGDVAQVELPGASAALPADATAAPVISVIVACYNGRERIERPLRSLAQQDLGEPYEVILVDSGSDGCAAYVRRAYRWVRVVESSTRLNPARARNRGVQHARGRYVAFVPDDGVVPPDWLRRRVRRHRDGYEAVGGAITNGTPYHPIGSAGYYLEYSALIPSERVLEQQRVPHCLSYERAIFDRLGGFPEGVETGEDTVFNERCIAAGMRVGFDPSVQLAHVNLRGWRPYLRHQYRHGQGLTQCAARYERDSPFGRLRQTTPGALSRMVVVYPLRRWWNALLRIGRGRPRWVAGYLVLSPIVWAGAVAAGLGAWSEWRSLRSR